MTRDQIAALIRRKITDGEYAPGSLLPAERLLARTLGTSRPTLRRAYEPLVKEGLLENQPGRGTFVADGTNQVKMPWRILALLLPDITNRFYAEVAESIEYAALQRGYQLLLCNSRHQVRLEEFHIRQIVKHRVHGVILAHDPHQETPPSLDLLAKASIPAVLLFSPARDACCDAVVLDERAGVEQALRYLCSLGHRRIAFCRPLPGPTPHPRETYFRQFFAQNTNARGEFLLDVVEKDDHQIQQEIHAMMSISDPPTACLAGNDHSALLLLKHLSSAGIAVPQDFSVVGFDNLRFVQHLAVPLTTIDQPKQEMGRRAAEMLFERMDAGYHLPFRQETFTPHLVIRDSCTVAPAFHTSEPNDRLHAIGSTR